MVQVATIFDERGIHLLFCAMDGLDTAEAEVYRIWVRGDFLIDPIGNISRGCIND